MRLHGLRYSDRMRSGDGMKIRYCQYIVNVAIDLSREELDMIIECSKYHYDAKVVSASKQGGFLYGWNNRMKMDILPIVATASQIGTCAKAIEAGNQPWPFKETPEVKLKIQQRFRLTKNLVEALALIREKYETINKGENNVLESDGTTVSN